MTAMESLILDNPVFNVKGEGKDMLLAALTLGINCVGENAFVGYRLDDKKGIVLYWADSEKDGYHKFMIPSKPEDIVDQLFQTVNALGETMYAEMLQHDEDSEDEDDEDDDEYWDKPCDDGDVNSDLGWRIYTEKWGHIDGEWQACLAIVPSFLWTSN